MMIPQAIVLPLALIFLFICLPGALAQNDKASCQPGAHNFPSQSPDPIAPDTFRVTWRTTASEDPIVLEVMREWAPLGVDRFYQLVLDNYYNCAAFFRVVPNFVVQFGLASEPAETSKWDTTIPDDPVVQSNLISYVSFATAGENTRTAQVFINLNDNANLDQSGFTPFGRIVQGMDVVQQIYNPTPGNSNGVNQGKYTAKGNQWLLSEYPDVDLILETRVDDGSDTSDQATKPSEKESVEYVAGTVQWVTVALAVAEVLGVAVAWYCLR